LALLGGKRERGSAERRRANAKAFVGAEEEQLILLDRSAGRRSELVLNELRNLRGREEAPRRACDCGGTPQRSVDFVVPERNDLENSTGIAAVFGAEGLVRTLTS
jgi:hypothetical protein